MDSQWSPDSSVEITPSVESKESHHVLHDEENFIRNVSQFFNKDELSDVTIVVGEKRFFGHRFVLAKSSDVFRTMLYDDRWKQGGETEIVLTESQECQSVFHVFLRFLYTAEMKISAETSVGILCLADKYNIISLKTLCVGFMVEHSKSPNVQNALNWYSWAKALHLADLLESCTKTIAWNVESILSSQFWFCMDVHFVQDVIRNSQLVVYDEFTLYSNLVKWLLSENHLENLVSNTEALLPLIRFPQMMVNQLYEIENSDFAKMYECKDLMKDLISKAYRFRSLCPAQLNLHVSFDDSFYQPRNYLYSVVDTLRIQSVSRFGLQVDVRTNVGPVPSDAMSGDWKITYRKNGNVITMQIIYHDSTSVPGEAYLEVSTMVTNDDDKVIQVDISAPFTVTRSKPLLQNITLGLPDESRNMMVILKPLPH